MDLFDEVGKSRTDLLTTSKPLEDSWEPDRIVSREEEMHELVSNLYDIRSKGEAPPNIFVYGPNGVGKTEVTTSILKKFEEDEETDVDFNWHRVNCEPVNTPYQFAVRMANKFLLDEERYPANSPGVGEDKIWETLWNEVDSQDGIQLFVLDEVHTLSGLESLFYNLSRAENEYLDNADFAFIAISTEGDLLNALDQHGSTTSSLKPTKQFFSSYEPFQLQKIGSTRAAKAFHETGIIFEDDPEYDDTDVKNLESKYTTVNSQEDYYFYSDVLTADVVPWTAAKAAGEENGDARVVLFLLREAARRAEKQGDELVTRDHAEQTYRQYKRSAALQLIKKLNETNQALLLSLAVLAFTSNKDDKVFDSGKIREQYKHIIEGYGETPVGTRRIRDGLNELHKVNLTTKLQRKNPNSGSRHDLLHDAEIVLEALGESQSAPRRYFDAELLPSDVLAYLV